MLLPISSLYVSVNALIIIYLAFRVIRIRFGQRIGLGSGGNKELSVLMRAHANNIEASVTVLPLLIIAELNGVASYLLHGAGLLFVFGRLFHFFDFIRTKAHASKGRFLGTLSVWICAVGLAAINIYRYFLN